MTPANSDVWNNEQLGHLAMQFRGTRRPTDRATIAKAYAEVVDRLIENGGWEEMPSLEDQLPDDWMPDAFFKYWDLVDEELDPD